MLDPFRTSAASVLLAATAASIAVLAPRPAVAQEGQEGGQAAMMEAFAEASMPGPAHEVLAKMAGEWDLTVKFWMAPGEPTVSTATSSSKMILGGRYLQDDVRGEIPGMGTMEGRGYTGYDNVAGVYRSVWIDNMSTGMTTGEGTYDEASRTMNFVSTYTDPFTKSEKKTRDVIRFVSDDEYVYESFEEGPDGSERKTMEIVYERKG